MASTSVAEGSLDDNSACSSRLRIEDLPPEIVTEIFEAVMDDLPWNECLRHLTLSKQLSGSAQLAMLANIVAPPIERLELLSIFLAQHPRLAAHVGKLLVGLQLSIPGDIEGRRPFCNVLKVISQLPHLRSLHITLHGNRPVQDQLAYGLQESLARLGLLRELQLFETGSWDAGTIGLADTLAAVERSGARLHTLGWSGGVDLGDIKTPFSSGPGEMTVAAAGRLSQLEVLVTASVECLAGLLDIATSIQSLTIYVGPRSAVEDALIEPLCSTGGRLRHLQIEHQNPLPSRRYATLLDRIIAAFTRLERLSLSALCGSTKAFALAAPTLSELHLDRQNVTFLDKLPTQVLSPSPTLRTLHLSEVPSQYFKGPRYTKLKHACRQRTIRLLLDDQVVVPRLI